MPYFLRSVRTQRSPYGPYLYSSLINYLKTVRTSTATIIARVSPSFDFDYVNLVNKSILERDEQGVEEEDLDTEVEGATLLESSFSP